MNVESIRNQFPLLQHLSDGKRPYIYLDNAATSQKPQCVLDAIARYYGELNANIHRGAHRLSVVATDAYEAARESVADFMGANNSREIVFTSGCTSAINLVAQSLALSGLIKEGDEILVSTDAHHSNIVPWQMLCERTGAILRPIPLDEELRLDFSAYEQLLTPRTALIALPVISNALGHLHPVAEFIAAARRNRAETLILIDGAQSTGHFPLKMRELGADFYALSGHKVYAPTGTGVLWGREELLQELPAWQGGGEMIREVRFTGTTYNDLPYKYEAGTPNIEGNIVLAEALKWVSNLGEANIAAHEHQLIQHLYAGLSQLDGMRLLGGAENRGALISCVVEGVHHYDLGTLLDQMGIAVRTGHHCCQPLMQSLGIAGTTRYSVAAYNTMDEMDVAIAATERALNMLR